MKQLTHITDYDIEQAEDALDALKAIKSKFIDYAASLKKDALHRHWGISDHDVSHVVIAMEQVLEELLYGPEKELKNILGSTPPLPITGEQSAWLKSVHSKLRMDVRERRPS